METLAEAALKFKADLATYDSAVCLCCHRSARVAKLRVHSTLARMLISIYVYSKDMDGGWVHLESFRPKKHGSGRDFCILKHWGLTQPKAAAIDEDKNSSGYWRLTEAGRLFVEGGSRISKNIFTLDDMVIKKSDEQVSIQDCLTKKFSWQELINHYG